MITEIEKKIYNTYLRISRSSRGKPFSYRNQFDNISSTIELSLQRISTLLYKYPHIDVEDYFIAPFKVYPNEEHFSIDYYAGMGAVNAYTIYMKQVQEMSPDSDEQLKSIKKSLVFIGSFCIRNKINIEDYPSHKTGITYDWMKHVKMHQVSAYALMEFPEVLGIIQKAAQDEKDLFLGTVGDYFWSYRSKYIKSTEAKILVREGIKRITKTVNSKI